jgi:hypothetical protein
MASAMAWGETPLLGLSPQLARVKVAMAARVVARKIFDEFCIFTSGVLLTSIKAFCRHIQTLDMIGGIAGKVPVDQRPICQGIKGITEPVAVQTDTADHLLIWAQVEILVVLDPIVL